MNKYPVAFGVTYGTVQKLVYHFSNLTLCYIGSYSILNVTFLFFTILIFCKGWKPNTHYTYSYNGRVATAIKELKQQWALIHVTGILNVQSHEAEDTLIVKVQSII